jgi:hypothetical protein
VEGEEKEVLGVHFGWVGGWVAMWFGVDNKKKI